MKDLDEKIKLYCKERDEMLRSLDVEKFHRFYKKHKLVKPHGGWLTPEVPLIMMHKARMQINSFTEEEKEVSRKWLLSHNYSLEIG